MKATGIVRRIDDLGRVVIPKEIRRTMFIREGDSLEIFTNKEGEVIFKKYSPLGEFTDFATHMCESLNKTTGYVAAVTDRDSIIAVAGASQKDIAEKRISSDLEKLMEGRQIYQYAENGKPLPIADGLEKYALVAAPIISEGDVMGEVLFISEDLTGTTEVEYKIAQTAATFLGKQMES